MLNNPPGEVYWRINDETGLVDENYPKPMRGWDMPFGVDAALVYTNKKVYLFRSSVYYKFNDETYLVGYLNVQCCSFTLLKKDLEASGPDRWSLRPLAMFLKPKEYV